MASAADYNLDPRRLLEMALEAMAPTAPAAPPIAEVAAAFPELRIDGLIGQGGMGTVYRAFDPVNKRDLALKVLARERADAPEFVERFAREASVHESLMHEHIVAVRGHGVRGEHAFLLCDYVDGADLRQLLDGGAIAAPEALRIVAQICAALCYAHQRGIVHRDVKPANVLVDADGNVHLADFGLAKAIGVDADWFALTRSRDALGTPHYMAPEQQLTHDVVGAPADVYSVGVVLYEALTGRLPIGHFPPPSHACGCSRELDALVLSALTQDPVGRPSMAELREALRPVDRLCTPRPSRAERLRGGVGVALMLALLIATVAMVFAALGEEFQRDSAKVETLPVVFSVLGLSIVGLMFAARRRQQRERPTLAGWLVLRLPVAAVVVAAATVAAFVAFGEESVGPSITVWMLLAAVVLTWRYRRRSVPG